MPTNSIQSTQAFQELANAVMRAADTNRDGSLSRNEFSAFLSNLIGGAQLRSTPRVAVGPTIAGVATSTAEPALIPPGGYQAVAGFDTARLNNSNDLDPKTVFGRFVSSKGGHITADDVRAFVAADPRWEIDPTSSQDDPHIRVKQSDLDKWKPGESVWQDVIRDSGPGGANAGQFSNA